MYRLYLDEVGTDDLTHTEKDDHRFLSLTGVVMRVDYAGKTLTPNLNWIKLNILRHDPDTPIILHRKDIMGRKGGFECLNDRQISDRFELAILRLLNSSEYSVITALIDKKWMLKQQHWTKIHPYHYLIEIIVEKYVQFLERNGSVGDIMPESRQTKPDTRLQKSFSEIRNTGTQFLDKNRISDVLKGEKLKFRTKRDNIAGLQICDLVAHPSHVHVRSLMGHNVTKGPFATEVISILNSSKYDRSKLGGIKGYGIKHLP